MIAEVPQDWKPELANLEFTRETVFCMAPWASLTFLPNGRVYPCCRVSNHYPVGNLNESTLRELWNSERLRQMRRNMLEGKPSLECHACYYDEAHGHRSARQSMNQSLAAHRPVVDETRPDGTLPVFRIPYLNPWFSNVCTFACVYCNYRNSSTWYPMHAHVWKPDRPIPPRILIPTGGNDTLWEQIEPLIPGLEEVYFIGGEPLISPVHYRLLHALLDQGRRGVVLRYSTNFDQTRCGSEDVLALWNGFERVIVNASLDSAGGRGEYIRFGQDWKRAVENRERMSRDCPRVEFNINPTLTVLNALHVADFHREWLDKGYLEPARFHMNVLTYPPEFSVQILPSDLKRTILEKFQRHVEWLKAGRNSDAARQDASHFELASAYMMEADKSELLERFRVVIRRLDEIRKTDFNAVFPELAGLGVS